MYRYLLIVAYIFTLMVIPACSYSGNTTQVAASPAEDAIPAAEPDKTVQTESGHAPESGDTHDVQAVDNTGDASQATAANAGNAQPTNENPRNDMTTTANPSEETHFPVPEDAEDNPQAPAIKAARKKLPSRSSYEPMLFVENWVLFDKGSDAPRRMDYGSGKERRLVHTRTGVIEKNDLKALGQFFKDIHLFENRQLNDRMHLSSMVDMVSSVLDENSLPISGDEDLPWENEIKLEFHDDVAVLDYWNYDTAGMRARIVYTHHVITITKDYAVSEERERRSADGDEI